MVGCRRVPTARRLPAVLNLIFPNGHLAPPSAAPGHNQRRRQRLSDSGMSNRDLPITEVQFRNILAESLTAAAQSLRHSRPGRGCGSADPVQSRVEEFIAEPVARGCSEHDRGGRSTRCRTNNRLQTDIERAVAVGSDWQPPPHSGPQSGRLDTRVAHICGLGPPDSAERAFTSYSCCLWVNENPSDLRVVVPENHGKPMRSGLAHAIVASPGPSL